METDGNRISKHSGVAADVETLGYEDTELAHRRQHHRNSKCIRCNSSGDSFQRATRAMLSVSQFFGIMPLIDVRASHKSPTFSWRSPSTLYTLLLLAMSALETSLCIFQMYERGFFFGTVGALTFYLLSLLSRSFCLALAMNWPRLIQYWQTVEDIFLELPYTSPRTYSRRRVSLANRINFTYGFITLMTLAEHMVYNYIHLMGVRMGQTRCQSSRSILELFLRSQRHHVFRFVEYRHWMAPILFWLNVCFTYTGSYLDSLIICVGWAFIVRFNQITDRLQLLERHVIPERIWMQIRQHYAMLHELLLVMDDRLSLIILLCSASNLYFICLQLFNVLNHMSSDVVGGTYQVYSVLFTILRFFTVLLVASTVRDASQKPLKFIYKVASANWNVELTRFSKHIRTGGLALSGRGLFYFTRQLILTVIGTVITYELVMLDAVNDRSPPDQEACNGTIYSNFNRTV